MFFPINNIKSHHITLNHGVPQGSSNSPILFILYVSNLTSSTHDYKVHRSKFTDDICDFTSAKQTRFIQQQQLQSSINQITTYSGVYRIGLNAGKTAHICEKHQTHHNQQHKHTNSQQRKISRNHLRFITIIYNAHQINPNQSQTPHHSPTHHLQPVIRSINNHHDSLIQNIRTPTFRIRSHRHHHRIIQKYKHLGRHSIQIHQKHPPAFPHIQRKCRRILELIIHQTSSSTPF